MNKDFLKRLTEAHSWLGLVISGALFVIFFAGSASLFRDEIEQWSIQPHLPISEIASQDSALAVSEILAIATEEENFDPKGRLTLLTPTKNRPYYSATVNLLHEPGEPKKHSFYIDPNTGEKFYHIEGFKLSRFIYDLHTDLKIPAGDYVVGFVTLFFFFALISGIIIHARNLIKNFFKYRSEDNPRSKLLDMHNVIGVMSLPFTLTYALSGLIFNLVIIYQISFAVFIYQGNQQALLSDAGITTINPEWKNAPLHNSDIDLLYQNTIDKYNNTPRLVQVYHYGDESAVIRFSVDEEHSLTTVSEVAYHLKDNSTLYLTDAEHPNTLREGLRVLSSLHFADFAGIDLRLLYFILGMGVCVLIVAGNLLWIDKRNRLRHQSQKTLTFIKGYTLTSTGGVIFSIVLIFLIERLLPMQLNNRADCLMGSFAISLIGVACAQYFYSNKKHFLGWLLRLSGFVGFLVILFDWILFRNEIIRLWSQGVTTIIGTEIFISITSVILILIGNKLIKNSS